MEEKSLQDYDESLRELEQQRVLLERVMEKMGQEWEESGAGIAWLGSLDLPSQPKIEESDARDKDETPTIFEDMDRCPGSLPAPLVEHTEPGILESTDYVHSILNANETLLAQGHYPPSNVASTPTTPDEYPQSAVFGSITKTLDCATSSGPTIVGTSGLSQDLSHDA